MTEYMIEVSCREDRGLVQNNLRQHSVQFSTAEDGWVEESIDGKQMDALYLSVRTTEPRSFLESLLHGHGWAVAIIAARQAKSFPA
jgi:hypothetical protein